MGLIAAIADIHGNYLALDAVLADIAGQGVTEILDLGDMIGGPMDSGRTLDRLMALGAVHVRGNHDRYPLEKPFEELGPWDRTAHAQLKPQHFDWLRALPATAIYRDTIFMCHAMPSSDETYWLEQVAPDGTVTLAPRDVIERCAEGIAQRMILCAHSHVPRAVTLSDGRMIVNPGSVGIPGYRDVLPYPHVMQMGTPDARYAILEDTASGWNVTFRQVKYDHMAMADLAARNGHREARADARDGMDGLKSCPGRDAACNANLQNRDHQNGNASFGTIPGLHHYASLALRCARDKRPHTAAEIHCCSFAFGAAPT